MSVIAGTGQPTGSGDLLEDQARRAALASSARDSCAAPRDAPSYPALVVPTGVGTGGSALLAVGGELVQGRSAAELHIHKQTPGYRIRKIEQITGPGVTTTGHIAEWWLALRP